MGNRHPFVHATRGIRNLGPLGVLVALCVVSFTLLPAVAASPVVGALGQDDRGQSWTATWGASPVVGSASPFPGLVCQAGTGVTDQTVRDVVFTSVYEQLIAQVHARGLPIFGGTLTPYKGAFYWTQAGEQTREVVNHWILTSRAFDGVVDFAAATADPADPLVFNPAFDSGDHLHPNDAGYQAMADAVNLNRLLEP
jgi:hypothetical protein